VDNRRVSQIFTLSFSLELIVAVSVGQQLLVQLPSYDVGFVRDPTTVVCRLNNIPVGCIPFMKADSFLLDVTSPLSNAAGVQNEIKIEYIQWPRFVQPLGIVTIRVLSAARDSLAQYQYANMLQALPNFFFKYLASASKNRRGEADVLYEFTFQTRYDIPDGANIVLDLPTDYSLLASVPPVIVLFPNFSDSTTGKLNYYYSSAKVTIENIGAYPKQTDFRIQLKGVRNPSTSTVFDRWTVSLNMGVYLIEQQLYFASFSLNELATPSTITVNSISSFPDNTGVKGDHEFSFTPRSALKEGAKITIYFPSQYRLLPSEPICIISGELKSFESCVTELNSIVITLNTVFLSGSINIKIKEVANPVFGETDKFIIQTSYDGQIVDIIDTSSNAGKTIFITPEAVGLFVNDFGYDPQNEGEIATYKFTFNPKISLTKDMELTIKFPESFDNKLGDKVVCYPLKNLNGNVKCNIAQKIVRISGFDPVTPTDLSPLSLEIRGVVNPNRRVNSDAGTISIGVLYTGTTTYLSYVQEAGVVETVDSAGWTFFQSVTTSNLFSRFTSDYLFTFTVYSSIPNDDSGGLVLIDLPQEFSPSDGSLGCAVVQEKYGTSYCNVINNRIYVRGNAQPYSGQLAVRISKLLNPLETVETSYFYLKTYDGFRKKIVERSFYNLDPFYFSYVFAGPTIRVNNDLPLVVEAGTQSIDLLITMTALSSLDIVIKPSATTGISFVPFQVPIGIGENTAKIRVSVSENFAEGDYQITWNVLRDLIPAYYNPIRPTIITVTKKRGVLISVEPINDIPFGGTSLPCKFSVLNAPDSNLEIRVNTKFDYKGIALDRNLIFFNSGVTEGSFSVLFTDRVKASEENLSTGQIELSISGQNKEVYKIDTITLYFNIIQEDITSPNVLELKTTSIDQFSVQISIKTDDVVACYYMVSL
jgi:hypothetical protein